MSSTKKRVCPSYEIHLMQENEIDQALDVWKEIGLYEGKHSIQTFRAIDPKGFYVAVNLDDNNKVIGCCGGVDACPNCVFIGLYAVRKKFQGMGIGIRMFETMMKNIGDKNAGLYPLEKHISTYKDKAGFKLRDTHEVIVYEIDSPITTKNLIKEIPNLEVVPFTEDLLDEIVKFDEKIVNHKREKLLKLTFCEPEAISRIVINCKKEVLAFGCLRLHNANKVIGGPIYAENDEVAELLIYNLIKDFPVVEKGLTLMIPDCNKGSHVIAKKLNLIKLYQLIRLFTKEIPKGDMKKIYCIHSPNFYPF